MDKALNGEDGLVVKTGKFADEFTKKLKPAKEELVNFVKAFNELL
jgi:hypothetical protein